MPGKNTYRRLVYNGRGCGVSIRPRQRIRTPTRSRAPEPPVRQGHRLCQVCRLALLPFANRLRYKPAVGFFYGEPLGSRGGSRKARWTLRLSEFDAGRLTVSTPSGALSCVTIGQGPPALFIHGIGTNAYLWRNVIGAVANERRCIALDLPLHGRSQATEGTDFSLGGLTDAVERLCDELDLTHIDVVANDTGGAIAQILATRDPARLRTLTLTDCETHDNVPPEGFKPTVELAKAGAIAPAAPDLLADPAAARAAVFAMGYQDPQLPTVETVRAFLEPLLGTPDGARQFERLLVTLSPDDLLAVEPLLAQLTVPTLVVWGTDDELFDLKWAYWLRDTIPGVTEVVELNGARLFFPDERAAELVPLLLRHWTRNA